MTYMSVRTKLPISRGARRVAVMAIPSGTESNGRQNHADVSPAELLVSPLTES